MEPEVYQKTYQLQDKYWWFIGQQSLLRDLIKTYLAVNNKIKILDAGCGTGANLGLLQKYGWAVGLDYSSIALNFCRKNFPSILCQGSILNLPFKYNTFDMITVSDVLYHRNVKDDIKALREIYQHLKVGGLVLFREPAFNFLKRKHDIVEHTSKRYILNEFRIKIEGANFIVKDIFYANIFLFLVVLIVKLKEKFFESKDKLDSDLIVLPPLLNKILIFFSKIETALARKIRIPFGLGLVCVAVKH